jgi:hypothetical protein
MPQAEFTHLFDGREKTFNNWRKVGPNDFILNRGEIVTSGSDDFALLFYSSAFSDFLLRLEFCLSDPLRDNSGIFVRFRNPELAATEEIILRDPYGQISRNPAWIAAYSGFEIQIDEQARGSKQNNEPDGLDKNRTGAIYKIPTGQDGEPRLQDFRPAPPLKSEQWNDYEIAVKGQNYVVRLNGYQTTRFLNTDPSRGMPADVDPDSGYIGLQSYRDSRVSFRNIRIHPL